MFKDFQIKTTNGDISLVTESEVPDILKRAMILMLVNTDTDLRSYKGVSVYTAITQMNDTAADDLRAALAVSADRLRSMLKSVDETVEDVYFDTESSQGAVSITLNVRTTTGTATTTLG